MTQPKPKSQQTNSLAVASLVLGILAVTSMSILTGIPAIITGAMGLKNPEGRGMSLAGIIMGAISVLLALAVIVFFLLLLVFGAFMATQYDDLEDYQDPAIPSDSSLQQRRA